MRLDLRDLGHNLIAGKRYLILFCGNGGKAAHRGKRGLERW